MRRRENIAMNAAPVYVERIHPIREVFRAIAMPQSRVPVDYGSRCQRKHELLKEVLSRLTPLPFHKH